MTPTTSMTSMTGPPQDRMPPIPQNQWTDAQKKAAAEFAAARKQEVFGPFAVLLRSPDPRAQGAGPPRASNDGVVHATAH